MKRRVNSQQVAHLWGNQSQSEAWNAQRNFTFRDDLLFSYSTPIGRIVKSRRTGESVALLSSRSYSNTTAKQQGHARRAVSHLPHFNVPFLGVSLGRHNEARGNFHEGNLLSFVDDYRAGAARLARMRSRPWGDLRERLESERLEMVRYARLFDIGNKGRAALRKVRPADDYATIESAHARREEREADPKHQERLARARARREARMSEAKRAEIERRRAFEAEREREREERRQEARRELARYPERVADWRAGRIHDLNLPGAYLLTREERDAAGMNHGPLMRIVGAEVQTSQGARVPVSDIAPALAHVMRIWREGSTYAAGLGGGPRLGGFTLTAVTPDCVKVGCHTFARAEVERFAALFRGSDRAGYPASVPA